MDFAYFLHFPNASWLHSFCSPWGLIGRENGKDWNLQKEIFY